MAVAKTLTATKADAKTEETVLRCCSSCRADAKAVVDARDACGATGAKPKAVEAKSEATIADAKTFMAVLVE